MAKGRKPAIGGLARPEGFLDDIVRPVVQKAAKAVAKKTLSPTRMKTYTRFSADTPTGRAIRRSKQPKKEIVGRKALDLSNATAAKRSESYRDAAERAYRKGDDKKMNVGMAKARAARNQAAGYQGNVRKAAKGARRRSKVRASGYKDYSPKGFLR